MLNVSGAKHGVWYLSKIFFLHPACSKMVPMQLSSELEEVKAGRKKTDALASDTPLLIIIDL